MNKEDIYHLLQQKGMWYEVTEHPAVNTMQELAEIALPYPEADAKNLFVCDDKKQNYSLITVRGDKRVDLKEFRRKQQTRRLSFASEAALWELLGLRPGSVTPLGILNDRENRVRFYLDGEFLNGKGLIGVHPNENTATLWMKTVDLIELLREHGCSVTVAEI